MTELDSAKLVRPPRAAFAQAPEDPLPPGKRRSINKLLMPKFTIKNVLLPLFIQIGTTGQSVRANSAGFWHVGESRYWIPRFVFRGGKETGEPLVRLAIFAGIHGDEPAGVHALVDFLRGLEANPWLGRAYRIHLYPLCNPTGYEDGTRNTRSGKDLNREFWRDSLEPEVAIIERELLQNQFHGIISLHSDDTSDGLYGFVRGHTMTEHLMKPALAAAEAALPVNQAQMIDGFDAVEGIIRSAYDGILSAPPGSTLAPFEIILESPQHAPMDQQCRAFVLALSEILRHYRRLISYAADI